MTSIIPIPQTDGDIDRFRRESESLMTRIIMAGYERFDFLETELGVLFGRVGRAFANAPASSSMSKHHCYRGGLLYHTWEVFALSMSILKGFYTSGAPSQVLGGPGTDLRKLLMAQYLLVAYIHDLHKATDFFGTEYYVPNILKNGQQSDRKPFEINDGYLEGLTTQGPTSPAWTCVERLLHREKKGISGGSVSLAWIEGHAPRLMSVLNEDMQQAIVYHDGGYGKAKYELSGSECQMTMVVHAADMLSSRQEMSLVQINPLETLLERLGLEAQTV